MKTLRLGFTSETDHRFSPQFHLSFQVEDSRIGQKWSEALVECLEKRLFFEKNYSLMGVPEAGRTLLDIEEELGLHLAVFDRDSELLRLRDEAVGPLRQMPSPLTQRELNQIHHLFEILIGQVWAPSAIYGRVNSDLRHSIRQLNHLVHEYESLSKAIGQRSEGRVSTATLIVAFLEAPRFDLAADDYAEMVFDRSFGDVFLHYAQLGKSHMEAFLDRDHEIDDDNISGLRYLTGEFDIHLGADFQRPKALEQKRELETWLREKGVDPADPRLSLGRYRVARLSPEIAGILTPSELQSQLRAFPNLVEISLDDGAEREASRSYPYTRRESETFAKNYFSDSRLRKFWNRISLGARMIELS